MLALSPTTSDPTVLPAPPLPARRTARPQPRTFRPDVEGLRALAVIVVVAYHAHLGVRGGFVGVDVFFVISGFLITRLLVWSVDSRGIRALPAFYARRIRRLLPASTVVVIATLIAARVWAPPLQRHSIAVDSLFTSFYALNYRLAVNGTQYLHATDAVSPLQHFWSLGVEEQFYFCWPLLIVIAAVLGRRHRRGLLALALVALVAVSLAASITLTHSVASWAYFSLHTRAWELGVGALVALAAPYLTTIPHRLAGLIALAGLAAVVASAFWYSPSTPYPGTAAALPVFGTAAVIAAGCGFRRGVERILGDPALQSVGRVSYSWYLWHWPMLVMAPYVIGHPLNWLGRLCVVWLSLAAAIVCYFTIEERFRWSRAATWRGLLSGLGMAAATVCAATLVVATLPAMVGRGAAVTLATADSASSSVLAQMHAALVDGVTTVAAPRNLTPTPAHAPFDRPAADTTNCHADFHTVTQGACVWGDPAGSHTVVLFGDSHADMWLPAFDRAGKAAHWRVIDWTKSACPAAQLTVHNSVLNRTYTECDTWRRQTIARIVALRPDRVLVTGSENVVGASVSATQYADATLATLRALRGGGITASLIADVPVPGFDLPGCVAAHLSDVRQCTFGLSRAYSFPSRHRELTSAAHAAGFAVIDPQAWICPASTCPAVVGNLLVYRDQTHLTATFSAWLAPHAATVLGN